MRRPIEWSDRHPRDPLHQQTLIDDGTQRFQGRWWLREETLRVFGPELIHDDPVGHVHEPEANRWFVRLYLAGFGRLGPAHRFQKGQRERGSDPFQAGAPIDEESASDRTHTVIMRLVGGFVDGQSTYSFKTGGSNQPAERKTE